MKYETLIEWLRKNNFVIEHSEHFYPEFLFCKKGLVNIIVKKYDTLEIHQQIRSDAVDARELLNKLGENVWNTYFLIFSTLGELSIPYTLEKDSIGLRKYVINEIEDLKRIPFLDMSTNINKSIKLDEINIDDTKNEVLNKLIKQIVSDTGLQRSMTNNEIDNIVYNFYNLEMNEDEDKEY